MPTSQRILAALMSFFSRPDDGSGRYNRADHGCPLIPGRIRDAFSRRTRWASSSYRALPRCTGRAGFGRCYFSVRNSWCGCLAQAELRTHRRFSSPGGRSAVLGSGRESTDSVPVRSRQSGKESRLDLLTRWSLSHPTSRRDGCRSKDACQGIRGG